MFCIILACIFSILRSLKVIRISDILYILILKYFAYSGTYFFDILTSKKYSILGYLINVVLEMSFALHRRVFFRYPNV